jgi:hypothetical protein
MAVILKKKVMGLLKPKFPARVIAKESEIKEIRVKYPKIIEAQKRERI